MEKFLTVSEIMGFDPCYDREQVEQLFADAGYADKPAPLSVILDAQIPATDILWLVLRLEIIEERKLHEIGIFAAELVLSIFEAKYPDDDSPREAIKAKKLWLDGKISDEELYAASAGSYATACAARAGSYAAAYAAACAAAYAAARAAAYAAGFGAARAARAAAKADAAVDAKILNYIKQIISR